MKLLLKLLMLFFFIAFCGYTYGQNTNAVKITATFQKEPIVSILDQLAQKYPLHFYYKEEDLPDTTYTLFFRDASLNEVMKQLLAGTQLGYFNYRTYNIIIAPQSFIDESFSAAFYATIENNLQDIGQSEEKQPDLIIGDMGTLQPNGKARVIGEILETDTEEPIIGATVYWTDLDVGTATDAEGKFDIEIPSGRHDLIVQYVGYEDYKKSIAVLGDGRLAINLDKAAINLKEVLVRAEAQDVNIESAQIGVDRLDVKSIKKLPSFLGEVDVVKSLLLQPGVSTIGEGAIGFNVRGGEVDQNLLMQDDGMLFNSSHALGFFSTFNPELISYVTLYKGNLPAQFGGRLASVLDVEMRDGSFQQYSVKGGLGLVSSKINLEGPIKKDKASFITGFRSSYSDWVLGLIKVPEVKRSSATFYDFNFRYTHRIDEKNTLTASIYTTKDRFTYNELFGYEYSTMMGQIIYRKIFSDKLFSKLSLTASRYESTQLDLDGTDALELDNDVGYYKLKEQLTYTVSRDLQLDAGISSILYQINPGALRPSGPISQIKAKALEREQGLESALFINANWTLSPAWAVSGGLRVGIYNALGPQTVFQYLDPENPSLDNLLDSTRYNGTKIIATYASIEPRVSFRYRLNPGASIKAGYSRTAQFINLIANTNTPTPSSQWQLSNDYIQPLRSHNFSVGYFQNYNNNNWELSAEIYGRLIDDLFDYQDFADLTVNDFLETELLKGIGRAYGLEVSVKKKQGRINGFFSYTLSKTEKKIEGINNKNWFPSSFDKPHDLSFLLNIQANQRNTLTFNFVYGTGRPTTAPIASYREANGLIVPIYSDRNQLRIPDYHRLDLAYTMGQGYNLTKKFKTSWTVSLYNVYSRQNAFSVFFTQKPFQSPIANKLSILGNIFPALTFNFETI
ncbi:MAG: TonB-dependent receptor [Saprospiraceae bacterium]